MVGSVLTAPQLTLCVESTYVFTCVHMMLLCCYLWVCCYCPVQVFQKLKEAEVTAEEIEKLREGYRPAARRGALLFFVLSDMAAINSMYQYSLNSYLTVFDYSLKKSLPDSHLPKRLRNIMDTLTYNVYTYACTG